MKRIFIRHSKTLKSQEDPVCNQAMCLTSPIMYALLICFQNGDQGILHAIQYSPWIHINTRSSRWPASKLRDITIHELLLPFSRIRHCIVLQQKEPMALHTTIILGANSSNATIGYYREVWKWECCCLPLHNAGTVAGVLPFYSPIQLSWCTSENVLSWTGL